MISPTGSNAAVYYGKLHTIDAATSTIPARFEELIAEGAGGYAAIEWAVYAVNRVNTGGRPTPAEFLAWSKQRLDYFRAQLKRLGRQNRVRVRALYPPARGTVSKAADYGP